MQENQPASQPEIDLFYFLRPVTDLIKKGWRLLGCYLLVIRRNLLLFWAILIFCGVGGYLLRYIIPSSFNTNAIFVSHIVPADICAEMIEDLNSHSLRLEDELKISTPAAASIRKLESVKMGDFDARRSYDSLLFYNNGDSALKTIKIRLYLRNQQYLDTIEHALVAYLERSPYARNRVAARKEALITLRTSLEKKLESLDSTQQLVNNSIVPRKEYAMTHPINPVDVYKATLYYNKEKILIDQELNMLDNVEILQPFTRFASFNYPNHLYVFLLALVIGLLLALILTPWLGKKPKRL
jgi:hypothetical protein